MQSLYGLELVKSDKRTGLEQHYSISDLQKMGKEQLSASLKETTDFFAYFAFVACRIALYAEQDAKHRSTKLLRTNEDLNVSTKIAGNTFVWDILENPHFKQIVETENFEERLEESWVKVLYKHLVESEAYAEYISVRERIPSLEKSIMKYLWTQIMLEHEEFNAYLSDEWGNWDDDYELNLVLMEYLFKQTAKFNFQHLGSEDKYEFAFELLETVINKDEVLRETLLSKLKNWDPERVATIDLVLLKMGIAEFLFFDSIPTKVSINEYIEIAKSYSTAQSGQFVNGILDNTLKDLIKQNRIHKISK